MKSIITVVCILLIAGCSSGLPLSSDSKGWQDYGYQQGQQGLVKKSANELTELLPEGLTPELYSVYSQAYDVGVEKYCAQDAFKLGTMQRPYYGVCDKNGPAFRTAYRQGQWEDDFSTGSFMSDSDYD